MDIMQELEARGAVILDRHFVYTSGMHGSGYINMDPVFPEVELLQEVGYRLAVPFYVGPRIHVVAAAATGGIPLAYMTTRCLEFDLTPAVVWADKTAGGFAFERAGFAQQITGKNVLVVEDLLNTGGSAKAVADAVKALGGNVVGISVVCNRGQETAESLGVPKLAAIATVDFQAYPAEDCPLCANNVPIVTDIGHGAKYQTEHADYLGGYVSLLS